MMVSQGYGGGALVSQGYGYLIALIQDISNVQIKALKQGNTIKSSKQNKLLKDLRQIRQIRWLN